MKINKTAFSGLSMLKPKELVLTTGLDQPCFFWFCGHRMCENDFFHIFCQKGNFWQFDIFMG